MKEVQTAVIYARYSSDKQREESIDGQIRVCSDYAKREGFTNVNTYIDRAMSAKTDKRPAFLRMVDDSKNCGFSAVIVYQLDRFSRNRYDSAVYKRKLKKYSEKYCRHAKTSQTTPVGFYWNH